MMRLLILVYNKLSELNYTHGTSFKHLVTNLRRMDEHIKEKVFRIVCSDLNLVARRKSHVYLMQVYACLDLPRLPNPNNKTEMRNLQEQRSALGGGTYGTSVVKQGELGEGKSL